MIMRILLIFISICTLFIVSCGDDCQFNGITNETLKDGKVGEEYYEQFFYDITCSYTSKYTELAGGELPPGLTLLSSCELVGTPTKAGEYTFTVKMRICFSTSAYGASDCTDRSKEFTLIILEE